MKKILFILLIFTAFCQAEDLNNVTIDQFKGLYDLVPAWSSRYPVYNSPDLANVKLDHNSIRKREGYVTDNTTSLGSFPVRAEWVYNDIQNEISYKYAVCGGTIWYKTGGDNFTILYSTISPTNDIKFLNYASKCYVFNVDRDEATMLIVDGVSVTLSTNCPTGTIEDVALWLERGWVLIDSYLYRSEPFDLDVWATYDGTRMRKEVNVDDGQKCRASKVFNGTLNIFKDYSWYRVSAPADMRYFDNAMTISLVNSELGCVYPDTIKVKGGLMTWFGNSNSMENGLYQTNGESLSFASGGIPNEIAKIEQTDAYGFSFLATSAEDFGAGTSVNIDTVTTSGSITISTTTINAIFYGVDTVATTEVGGDGAKRRAQYIYMASSQAVNHLIFYGARSWTITTPFNICISSTYHGTVLSSATFNNADIGTAAGWYGSPLDVTLTLQKDSTYYLNIEYGTLTAGYVNFYTTDSNYSNNGAYVVDYTTQTARDVLISLSYFVEYATYTSQSHNLGTDIVSFGILEAEETTPGNSTIQYQVASSSYNGGFSDWTTVQNNYNIGVDTGAWVQWRAIFETDVPSSIPSLQSAKINYFNSTQNTNLTAEVFNGDYWLAYQVAGSTYNTKILYFDRNNNFIPFTNMDFASFCVWHNNLYAGSSNGDGKVYRLEVDDVYSDNGASIDAYYRTQTFNWSDDQRYKNIRFYGAELEGSSDNFSVDLTRRREYDVSTSSTNHIVMNDGDEIVTDRFWIDDYDTRYFDIEIGDNSVYKWECTKLGYLWKQGRQRYEK